VAVTPAISGTGESAPCLTTALNVASGVGCCSGGLSAESTRPRQQPLVSSMVKTVAIRVIRLAVAPWSRVKDEAITGCTELGVTVLSIR
jgi:hypothetical protein